MERRSGRVQRRGLLRDNDSVCNVRSDHQSAVVAGKRACGHLCMGITAQEVNRMQIGRLCRAEAPLCNRCASCVRGSMEAGNPSQWNRSELGATTVRSDHGAAMKKAPLICGWCRPYLFRFAVIDPTRPYRSAHCELTDQYFLCGRHGRATSRHRGRRRPRMAGGSTDCRGDIRPRNRA